MRRIHNDIKNLIKYVIDGGSQKPAMVYAHKIFQRAITIIICINVISIIASTFEQLDNFRSIFIAISYISSIVFTIEYALRIFSAPGSAIKKRALKLRFGYIVSFMGIVDFVTILPYTIQFLGISPSEYAHITEFTKIFVTLKLLRYSVTFSFILDVFYSVRRELSFAFITAISIVIISGLLMYQIEKSAQPNVFSNAGDGLWWSIITFTTVGYGDVRPVTDLGRFVAGLIAFAGIGILALPAGIISSAFIKRMNSLKNPDNAKTSSDTGSSILLNGGIYKEIRNSVINNRKETTEHLHSKPKENEENSNAAPKQGYCPHCGAKIED